MPGHTDAVEVAFGRCRIRVRSSFAGVLDPIRDGFGMMLDDGSSEDVPEIVVRKVEDRFLISSPSGRALPRSTTARGAAKHVRYEVLRLIVESHPEFVWLHAGAAAKDDRAVLLIGSWGAGKSTLAAALSRRGWMYISDDIVPIDPHGRTAVPFPLTPAVRNEAASPLTPHEVAGLAKTYVRLDPDQVAQSATSITSIILPKYSPELTADAASCRESTTAANLIENCLANGSAAFEVSFLCNLASVLPALHLEYSSGEAAASRLEYAHRHGYGGARAPAEWPQDAGIIASSPTT